MSTFTNTNIIDLISTSNINLKLLRGVSKRLNTVVYPLTSFIEYNFKIACLTIEGS